MSQQKRNIDQELMECIFKYRDALRENKYLSLSEREKDRQILSTLYQQLNTLKQKILDSKCYLQLGEFQREQTEKFLAEETSPTQRMEMLAYVVRCLCRPVTMISGKHSQLTPLATPTLEKQQDLSPPSAMDDPSSSAAQFISDFKVSEITAADIESKKSFLRERIQNNCEAKKIRKDTGLSHAEAEILSQMSANEDIIITVKTQKENLADLPVSVIIKES